MLSSFSAEITPPEFSLVIPLVPPENLKIYSSLLFNLFSISDLKPDIFSVIYEFLDLAVEDPSSFLFNEMDVL